MHTTSTLLPQATDAEQPGVLERPDGLSRGARFPDPPVEKIRGPKLIALWIGLAAGAWGVTAGAGYGLYVVVQSILP